MADTFHGDEKELDHFLLGYERALMGALLPRVPSWMQTTHLTLLTLVWAAGVVLCGKLAASDIRWLWGVSFFIFSQHVSDMLDGAVGRSRNTGLVKWGFYMDHFLDYLFMSCVVIGYAFLLPASYHLWVLACLVTVGGFMVHSFLDFGITNKFKISVKRFGVSEIRYVLIVFNAVLIVSGKGLLAQAFPFVVPAFAVALAGLIYASQRSYGDIDMERKDREDRRRPGKKVLFGRQPLHA